MTDEPRRYAINEIFYSVQGEGARAGSPNIFVRFSGCNLRCDLEEGDKSPGGFVCDTELTSGRQLTAAEILKEIRKASADCLAVVFTGGEPLLQLDDVLINTLKVCGYFLAIETNGTRPIPEGIDYVCVSPKVAEHALKAQRADELRYVISRDKGIPRPALKAENYFLSPAFDQDGNLDRATLFHCMRLCLENPRWRLSLQLHKVIGVR
jgi:organic radical activating enzyme